MSYSILPPSDAPGIPLVIHVPHASNHVPDSYRDDLLLDDDALAAEHLAMVDHHTAQMAVRARASGATVFINQVSRLVCDPERFEDDAEEPAAAYGMGAVYTRTHDGRPLRRPDPSGERRRVTMFDIYRRYHEAMTRVVTDFLHQFGRVWILDLHSFPARPLPFEDPDLARPLFCLGYDDVHRPEGWTEWWETHRKLDPGSALQLAHNEPFAGSFVPREYYGNDSRVRSMMLEVNRSLYMDETNGELKGAAAWCLYDVSAFLDFICSDIADIVRPPAQGISRRAARAIAAEYGARAFGEEVTGVSKVRTWAEMEASCIRTPFCLYESQRQMYENGWIAYMERDTRGWLCSSLIVVVDRTTGLVTYAGSANDEG